jgi:uncharacterized protein (TIGR00730 family)
MQAVMDVSSRIVLLKYKVALFRSFSKSGKRCTGLRPGLEPGPVPSFIDGQANQEGHVMRLCVFCGSNAGQDPVYFETAQTLGRALATNGIDLVYGGAAVGLMGAVADAALAKGGHVIGVMPQALVDKEIAHRGLSDLRVVGSMHERKALMAELADGFIALPGGLGTFEELFEVWTWAQLGYHRKPCALLNAGGFYDKLTDFLDEVVERGFVKPIHRAMLIVENEPAALIEAMRAYEPPQVDKWIKAGER